MIDPRTKLTILKSTNGTFEDVSESACDFSRDDFSMSLDKDADYLYIGFRKSIGAVYVELTTPNTNANRLDAQYYTGTGWAVLDLNDETKGFNRSGFLTFDRQSLTQTAVNGATKYWLRLRPSVSHTATVVRGINLVFADDASLAEHFPQITDSSLLPPNAVSHIVAHQAARNEIVQELRRRAEEKRSDKGIEPVDQWDLLDIFKIRQAAVYKALANIMFTLADAPGDKWYTEYIKWTDYYAAEIRGVILDIDRNDDGKADSSEQNERPKVVRLIY